MAERSLSGQKERDRYRAALEEVKRDCGKVCANFELCDHQSCASSCAAWMIADAALATASSEEER